MSMWSSLTPFEHRVNSIYLISLLGVYALDAVSTKLAIHLRRGIEANPLQFLTEDGYVLPVIWLVSIPLQVFGMRWSLANLSGRLNWLPRPSSFWAWLNYLFNGGLQYGGWHGYAGLSLTGGLICAVMIHLVIALNNFCIVGTGDGCLYANIRIGDWPAEFIRKLWPWLAGSAVIATLVAYWIGLNSRHGAAR